MHWANLKTSTLNLPLHPKRSRSFTTSCISPVILNTTSLNSRRPRDDLLQNSLKQASLLQHQSSGRSPLGAIFTNFGSN